MQRKKAPSPCSLTAIRAHDAFRGRGALDRSSPESLVQPPPGCSHLPLHPFFSHLGAGCLARCPPCHPSQETVASLCAPAAPFPGTPRGGLFAEGASQLPARGAGLAATPAGSTYLSPALPCTRADLAQRPSVFSEQGPPPRSTCSPSKATRGSWKMRTSGAGGI